MTKILYINRFLFLFISLTFVFTQANAYSLRQFSSKNGLSNSAILSICQDYNGFVWFGSCDGLNRFDGLNLQIHKAINGVNNLSGNLIENIIETENGILWVQTNYGLDRFDSRNNSIISFKTLKRKSHLAVTRGKELLLINEDNFICWYDNQSNSFLKIPVPGLKFYDVLDIVVGSDDIVRIFTKGRESISFAIRYVDNILTLEPAEDFVHEEELLYCFHEGDKVWFVDKTHGLYEYNLNNKQKYYIYDLHNEISRYGEISSLVKFHDDFYIGFKTSGLLGIMATPGQKVSYRTKDINIRSGIFCLVKDRFQDVLWVGTDGQGAYMYFVDGYSIKSTLFTNLTNPVNNPVRGIFIDKERTLWVGTKGDGILKFKNYDPDKKGNETQNAEHITTTNSRLNDNSVYVFAPSKKNIMWIGSEGGLNYYSYKNKQIKETPYSAGCEPVRYIHSIHEFNDTTLWIATMGEGIVKATLGGTNTEPVIRETRRFTIYKGEQSSNYFFTAYPENDSVVWFGNRGYGAFRMDTRTDTFAVYRFDHEGRNQTLNDIFSIKKNDEGYWFGTSYGLAHLNNENKQQIFNETNGFPNNTIHGILEDAHGNLWMSTNRGMVNFNMKKQTFQTYNHQNGLEVIEFSDGAYYKDELTGILFFGGINGLITIREDSYKQREYAPPILFNNLTIFGKNYNIHDFMSADTEKEILELNYSQNFFGISFTAIDYINGNNYTYFYKLNELSDNWIENGNSNVATFTNISPGSYTLSVKYRNNITGKEGDVNTLGITILPPWYMTRLAYLVCFLFILLIIYMCVRLSMKWYSMKKNTMIEKLNRQQKEEIYESKLRFFTNITHELCTPLTLIYGPCERIISYEKADNYISKYASIIMHNAEKLNLLIQELIEFRRLETGNKSLQIRSVNVSEYVTGLTEAFQELAESRNINYIKEIKQDIYWNTDARCLNKVINNLVSNAFKYTVDGGTVKVSLSHRNAMLHLVVSNTGKGIKEENYSKIFDRYKVLDDFEVQSRKGDASRNGLGMAICHNMVTLLEGEIKVRSVVNKFAEFRVILPYLQPMAGRLEEARVLKEEIIQTAVEPSVTFDKLPPVDKLKPTIMVIDDDLSMLWFIAEIFSHDYNVIPVQESGRVMELLKTTQPDLIITDIMMPGIDGISLVKIIKADKLLSYIPLILLSARNDVEVQVEGIDSGAEVYITKPFNVKYLEKVVKRLIQREIDSREYYNSIYSTVKIRDGKLLHNDDKEFFDRMLQIITDKIENPGLNVEMLSNELGISTRQLYRKLKNITEKTPSDIIRDYRIATVERLLVSSNLSVEEIMYKTGFVNRGNFFKIFAQHYGMTPKKYRATKIKELKGRQ